MSAEGLIHLILWPTLLGFLINGIFGSKLSKSTSGFIACVGPILGFIATSLIYFTVPLLEAKNIVIYNWFSIGLSNPVNFSVYLDHLTLLMLFIITGVGTLIHVYSIGYMKDDPGFSRFFAYLNLFLFSMILLVTGSNLVLLFAGWEGVGLCSFLLIGFWFKNPEYNKAARKAFVMNRIGDLGFILGIFLLAIKFNSVEIVKIQESFGELSKNDPSIILITLLLFLGVCGKSAQIPLFTWLPDAMAGPTPVSALIHAATMVTAGIYLVARMSLLFNLAPFTLNVIMWTGVVTAIVAASIALKQNDIKKVLAYSTVSQLGYMASALGVAAYSTAIFHVMTHAFFKALLFLAAGSVIHGLHGEQDIKNMGGLKSKMKVTHLVFLIGTLAIAGCPPLAGFFSKDEILASVYSWNALGFIVLAFASVFTAWYMLRLYFSTFHGKYRGDSHTWDHAHESPWIILFPLIVLAFLSIIGGFAGMPEIISHHHYVKDFLKFSVVDHTHKVSHFFEFTLWGVTLVVLAIIAFLTYKKYTTVTKEDFEKENTGLSGLLWNKYYLDEIYAAIFTKPLRTLGSWFKNIFERQGVDAIVRIPGSIVTKASLELKPLQSGNISWYMISILLGFLAFALLFLFKF
ncbi:MAG: NADH-quinone oxidoreductase subunit L [Saprospiraceae bacterium]|nr:NADH-quinone oxidoreductase subunit L [Saprospiraceae bacterium]